jgi:segregation and condensation protein A
VEQRNVKPVHTVVKYNYTMEESRHYALETVKREKVMSFEKLFDVCQDRIHAIFIFLSMLELVQMKYMTIMVSEGRNNFIVELNENWEQDVDPNQPGVLPPGDDDPERQTPESVL